MARRAIDHFVGRTTVVAVALFVTLDAAEMSTDWAVCSGTVSVQPDQRVSACTAVIETVGGTPESLAIAYCSRGVAYHARNQLGPAIADYNEAVRIAPNGANGYLCRGFGSLARR